MKNNLLAPLLLIGLSIVVNFGLWNVFFQQDEWFWFGQALLTQQNGVLTILQIAGFHFIPFSLFSFYFFYSTFLLHWQVYAVYTLFLHIINSILLFYLVKDILKNKYIAVISSIFFIVANVSQQAVTWYGASLEVIPATLFGLLSLMFFWKYYQLKTKKFLIFSYIFLFLGLGFKEDIMFLFIVYGLAHIFAKRIKSIKQFAIIACLGLAYFIIRAVLQKLGTENPISHISTLAYMGSIIQNIFILPLKSFSQLYFSPLMVYNLGHAVTSGHEHFFLRFSPVPNNIDIFIETVFFTIVTISLTLMFLALIGVSLYKIRQFQVSKNIVLLTIFTLISFSPFFLLPKGFGMESRHYYFPLIGASTLFAYMLSVLWKQMKRYRYLLIAMVVIYFGYNILLDRQQLDMVIGLSKPRITFIAQLQKAYQSIPNNAIFLSSADYLPFQSGMGQMIMVLFDQKYQFNDLLKENYLWDMGSQGYKKIGKESFGYFSDQKLLNRSYMSNNLPLSHIYSFSWDNKTLKLTDTSKLTREELSSDE